MRAFLSRIIGAHSIGNAFAFHFLETAEDVAHLFSSDLLTDDFFVLVK